MSRSTVLLGALAIVVAVVAGSQLGAQPVAPPVADQLPTGFVAVTTANSSEVQRLRNVAIRNLGGRAFLVASPGERQLTTTAPLVWIPVDVIVQMNETTASQ